MLEFSAALGALNHFVILPFLLSIRFSSSCQYSSPLPVPPRNEITGGKGYPPWVSLNGERNPSVGAGPQAGPQKSLDSRL